MATYYVRTTGSDSANGTSPATAWLTVSHALAAGALAAGDTVYVGAGIYRNTLAPIYSGSVGTPISIIGDVDGAQTGDAGEVVCTAYTASDKSAPSATTLLNLAAQSFLSFSLITFVGGSATIVTVAAGGHDYTFNDCTFNCLGTSGTIANVTSSTTGLAINLTWDRCTMIGGGVMFTFTIATTVSGSADFDVNVLIRNSLILCTSSGDVIDISATGTNAHLGGGVRVVNCILLGGARTFRTLTAAELSTTIPCAMYNSILASGNGLQAATSGQIVEDYNLFLGATGRTSVTAGTHSISNGSYAPMFELGQSFKWGAGTIRQFLSPNSSSSPILGWGADGGGNDPTVDWQNRTRPSGGGSTSYAVGPSELHDFAIQDKVIYNDSPSSGKLVGPGDQYILVPVDAISSTISIYLYFSGYGGTNYPTATLLANGELGVTTQVQTCSSSSATWQQLTFAAITPSQPGWVTVQISSFDTNGTGQVNFDTLAVQ